MNTSLQALRTRLVAWYHTQPWLRLRELSPVVRRALGLLARLVGLAVLGYMLYVTYREREVLLNALALDPLYLVPAVLCYAAGFVLAVAGWRILLRMSGIRHPFAEDYAIYAIMAGYRNLPLPYTSFASLLYYYQQKGLDYRTTGLAIVAQSILHVVAGIAVFAVMMAAGVKLQLDLTSTTALLVGAILLIALHPSVFRRLVRARGVAETELPPTAVTWRSMIILALLNIAVLSLGGALFYFSARAVLPLPSALLPLFIAAWCLMVSVNNLLSWLPSTFGVTQVLVLTLMQTQLSIGEITLVLATFRVCVVLFELSNAALGLALQRRIEAADGR